VLLCTLALKSARPQYRFLHGAKFEGVRIIDDPFTTPSTTDSSIHSFRARGTVESVSKEVQLELQSLGGWEGEASNHFSWNTFTRGDEFVHVGLWDIEFTTGAPTIVDGTVLIQISKPATPVDRVLARLRPY
jgi:hypothetical protein